MATRIIECAAVERRNDGLPIVPRMLLAQSTMSAGASSAQSAAFSTPLSCVLIQSDEAINVAIGANPTATSSNYRIQAGGEQFFEAAMGEKAAIIG